jgi:hypothetical protein
VRPLSGAKNPDKTDRSYCIYHAAHRDYTYGDKWISLLVAELGGSIPTVEEIAAVAQVKPAAPE